MKCALLGIRSKNEIRNVDVYKNAGFEDRVTRIAINKFNWKGYTVRLTDRKIDKGNFEQTIIHRKTVSIKTPRLCSN